MGVPKARAFQAEETFGAKALGQDLAGLVGRDLTQVLTGALRWLLRGRQAVGRRWTRLRCSRAPSGGFSGEDRLWAEDGSQGWGGGIELVQVGNNVAGPGGGRGLAGGQWAELG